MQQNFDINPKVICYKVANILYDELHKSIQCSKPNKTMDKTVYTIITGDITITLGIYNTVGETESLQLKINKPHDNKLIYTFFIFDDYYDGENFEIYENIDFYVHNVSKLLISEIEYRIKQSEIAKILQQPEYSIREYKLSKLNEILNAGS